ncbi:hypothetical protein [Pseudozobellia sp. WGM2]|uniref:hypothetical protein n=1 Tax=Pseudozobellia sp. WGM2 TaxID=2787625 RepID=UPI001ADF90CE|nr:hypothetical protein [Pseudozobellia sp. WGM2]
MKTPWLALFALILLTSLPTSCSDGESPDDSPVTPVETEVPMEEEPEIEEEEVEQEPEEEQEENEEDEEDEVGEENSTDILGTITLTGDETSDVGTSLEVAHIAVGRADLTGTTKSVILTDENTPITEEGPDPKNFNKGFVLIGGDDLDTLSDDGVVKDISMVIFIDSVEYRFGCSVPPGGTFTDCGEAYNINFEEKEMVFDSTTVSNTETGVILTLDGTIRWQ